MKPLDPVSVVDLFPGEREQLLLLLAALSDERWHASTACAGWSVKDIALHLLGDDIGRLSRQRDRFHEPAPGGAETTPTNWTELVAFINDLNEAWITATRRISPRLLCELLRFTGDATIAHFRALDPVALGGPVSWAGPAPAPVWLDIAREYTERWVHQQHIRDAVGQPGLKDRRWFAPVLDTFARALPHTLRDTAPPIGTCLRLVITGEAGGEWFAVREGAAWLLVQSAPSRPDATVTLDQETAWCLFTKGLGKAEALKRARLAGDRSLAARALDLVSIIA